MPHHQLDPVTYYTDTHLTSVDWPALEVPPDLDVPPDLTSEPGWDVNEWNNRGLSHNYPSDLFNPSLDPDAIKQLWEETEVVFPLLPVPKMSMMFLHAVAERGYSSLLQEIQPTVYHNVCLEPRLWTPTVLVVDSWLRKGFLHGPYPDPPFPGGKVNGLLCIPKGQSNVRVCTDFSRPKGSSFNDSISPSFKQSLPLRMADFSMVRRALNLAGSGARFLKHDIADAYKRIAVVPYQLPAQMFKLGSCFFYDSSLVFGDESAVHAFSFLHNGVVQGLVLPFSSLPLDLALVCIDDLCLFSPSSQEYKLWEFDYRYRYVTPFTWELYIN